jgi:uncharacterized repeat protein (TIGR04138 family)
MHHPKLFEIVQKDPRYTYEAYEFVFAGLEHTLERLGRQGGDKPTEEAGKHVTGPELLDGIRDLALREFGLMARTVFRQWGVNCTGDFGEIVFNLIDAQLMSKTDEDSRADFRDVYDLDKALVQSYRIELPRNVLGAELTS